MAEDGVAETKSDGPMLANQGSLPRLPIPSLEDTCTKFLKTVAPILTAEELERTRAVVTQFLTDAGPRLQEKLLEFDAMDENQAGSFLEKLWEDGYLSYRGPTAINVNPFFVLEDDPTPFRNSQIARATSLVISSLKFFEAVKTKTLEPDMFRKTPLCMIQYEKLFATCRVPAVGCDEVVSFPDSTHIVVMSRGQFYWFHVLCEDHKLAVTEAELLRHLRAIRDDSFASPPAENAAQAVAVLSGGNRDDWASSRHLLGSVAACNRQSLRVIDSALFLLCLDDNCPDTVAAMAENALHGQSVVKQGVQLGSCLNRWFDKMCLIVSQNGAGAILFEHSVVDGHTVLRYASDVFTDTILRFAQTIHRGLPSLYDPMTKSDTASASAPQKIVWRLTPSLKHAIRMAEARLSDLIHQNELRVLDYGGFGKRFIVAHRLSPDALVQVCLQLAYHALYGTAVSSYETVMTKQFLHGRTAASRAATAESAALVEIFGTDADPHLQIERLRDAVNSYRRTLSEASRAQDVDRHLLALRHMAVRAGEAPPPLFSDAGWRKLSHNVLSTSNCGNPALRLFGFGPVVADGYGIGYIIKEDGLQVCVTSKQRQTQRFVQSLETTLDKVRALLESCAEDTAGSFPLGAAASMPLLSRTSSAGPTPRRLPRSGSISPRPGVSLSTGLANGSSSSSGGISRPSQSDPLPTGGVPISQTGAIGASTAQMKRPHLQSIDSATPTPGPVKRGRLE